MKKKLLVSLASALFCFIILELALTVLGIPKEYRPHTQPSQFQDSANKDIGYTNLRSTDFAFIYDGNTRGYFKDGSSVDYHINSSGFRGPEIPLSKSPNDYRVFFLGDSFTFGEGVYFEDTYPQQFQNLAMQESLFGNKNLEALNLGVGGYNTSQEFALLKQAIGDGLVPDRVFVGYGLNDADKPIYSLTSDDKFKRNSNSVEGETLRIQNPPWWVKISRVVRIIWDADQNKKLTDNTIAYYHSIYNDSNPDWDKTKQAIKNFAEYQKSSGVQVTFILFPVLFDLKNYPFVAEEQKVKDELNKNGIDYIDIRPQLAGYNGPELWVHPTDQHPNEIVDKIIAEQLVKYFGNKNLAP